MKKATPELTQSRELERLVRERLVRERWLAEKLDMPAGWDAGVTTQEQRRDLIRAYVTDNQLADTVIARTRAKGAITPRLAFRDTFGVPLETTESEFSGTLGDAR